MTERPRSWDPELKTALRGVQEWAGSMHLTPKETVEEVTWPSWKIWESSCSDSTFCPPPIPLDPSAMCFLVNTAGPVPLSPSVHKRSPRLQGKEVCRWVVHVCLWASGPRHCYSAHVGAAESICADPWRRWSDHSKGAKKGSLVITSIYNPLLSLESVSPRRCARIETCQLSQMICVGVREEWIIWAFSGWWCKTKAEGPSRRPLRTLIEIRSAVRGVFTGAAFNLTTSRFLLSDLERKCFKLHGWFELETPSDAFVNIFNASMVIIFKACAGFF